MQVEGLCGRVDVRTKHGFKIGMFAKNLQLDEHL
jgi:hypothetical protein